MSQPLITIITCTYNSQSFLKDCLDSVAQQTYKNFEHIFIDGYSTDATEKIITDYQQAATIIKQVPRGIYSALNEGLQQAHGEIIGFLHADDTLADNNCLARIAKAFSDNPTLGYYCATMTIYDVTLKKPFAILGAAPHISSLREKMYSSTYFAHPTYYCRKNIIKQVGPYNEDYTLAGDIDWLYRLEQLHPSYFFDPLPLVKFRSSGSTSRHYLKALTEEFFITKKHYGLSGMLLFIYSWHLLRRVVRLLLTKLHLSLIITFVRRALAYNKKLPSYDH